MIVELHGDYESRSPVGPSDVGLHNYIYHLDTEPLFFWYNIGGAGYNCWRIWEDSAFLTRDWKNLSVPQDLDEAFHDPNVMFVAYNSSFERYMTDKLGWEIPVSRMIDPQAGGRYLSLPASLEVQGEVLGLPPSLAKNKRGDELVKLFCQKVFVKATKKNPVAREYYNDWNSHPKEWAEFLEYGKQDVVAEGELLRRMRLLRAMPLPPLEQKLWLFDQKVNDRGMPTDREFVRKMYALAVRAKKEAKENFEQITGVKNANSPAQIKAWAHPQGYPYPSLAKDIVTSALKDSNVKLSELCRTALKMRAEAASTSYQKLGKILETISPDGRLRGQFVYMGSSRCGRWSGNGFQMHNLARPGVITVCSSCKVMMKEKVCAACGAETKSHDFEDQKVVREARAMIYQEDYDGIKAKYGTVLLVVKNLIRTVFVAPEVA